MTVSEGEFQVRALDSSGVTSKYCSAVNVEKARGHSSGKSVSKGRQVHLRTKKASKPRADHRLWESLSDDQFWAGQQIYYGFKLRVAGIGYRTQVFSCLPQAAFTRHDGPPDLLETFALWTRQAQAAGISVQDVLDILVFGKSCREVDREKRKRKGYAKENLVTGLAAFISLK